MNAVGVFCFFTSQQMSVIRSFRGECLSQLTNMNGTRQQLKNDSRHEPLQLPLHIHQESVHVLKDCFGTMTDELDHIQAPKNSILSNTFICELTDNSSNDCPSQATISPHNFKLTLLSSPHHFLQTTCPSYIYSTLYIFLIFFVSFCIIGLLFMFMIH